MIDSTKDRILELYEKYEWLTGIHIHVGSQGVPLEKFVGGAKVRDSAEFSMDKNHAMIIHEMSNLGIAAILLI